MLDKSVTPIENFHGYPLLCVCDKYRNTCNWSRTPPFYSATVREGVTKFEMPGQKLLTKCLFLFIAPFDLWPLPWHECANLCCDHDIWRKMAWIAPKFACRLSFTQGLDKFENQFGPTSTFKMAADLKKWRVPFFSKCRNSGNNGWNCTIFGAQGDLRRPFDFSTFDPCVTSRDLSMTLTVFKRILRKWTLAPKLLGLEWCNLGKSYNKGLYSGFF